jgi:hypothetical protein
MSQSQSGGDDREEDAVRREAKVAADRAWSSFEQLGDRLEELALCYDDEDAMEAWKLAEDLVMDLDDCLAEAQEAIRDD